MTVATPTATAGLIAEHQRLATELVKARAEHEKLERIASAAGRSSMAAYYIAVELEQAVDAVEAALAMLDKNAKPTRPEGAETIKGKYAHNRS